MTDVRQFLHVLVLLICWNLSQEVVVEIVGKEGSSPFSASIVITDLSVNDELYFNSETPYRYKFIKFMNSKFEQIPGNIISKFPNLTSLDISNCGIRTIHRDDFKDLFLCKVLKLSDNQVGVLEEDVFTHLPNLKTLSLANMSLTELKTGLFNRQNKVTTLELQNNKIEWIYSSILEPLKDLQWINLRHNHIRELPSQLFIFNQNLHTIDLAFNGINTIDWNAFGNITLRNLILHHNYFPYLWAPECTTLSAHNGELRELYSLGPIKFLELASNRLEKIPSIDYSETIFMDLTDNHINNLESFHNATKLEKLYLNNNPISSLQDNAFESLTSLQQLLLANTELTSKVIHEDNMFSDMQNLQHLDLSGKFLNEIKLIYFRNLPKLEKILVGAPVIAIKLL